MRCCSDGCCRGPLPSWPRATRVGPRRSPRTRSTWLRPMASSRTVHWRRCGPARGVRRSRRGGCSGWRWPGAGASKKRCRPCAQRTTRCPTTRSCSRRCCAPRRWSRGFRWRWHSTRTTAPTCVTGSASTRPTSLQRLHRELLAADDPVRTGIRYDAEELLGREADLARLRSSVRSSRLTSIIGPGGIGKTRIAHVLAREATQARVHFVELVGITSPDDVVPEIGAALGVRDSVTSRRTHTPAQRADIRGRIAQELDTGPTLLVLDNCEHVVEAVASLVAFLLVTARDLRVVTTSRAPLNIAAEHVVPLDQLSAVDGAALFVRRATGRAPQRRPRPRPRRRRVVARLDGLPLAIELAAARIRTMSLEELRPTSRGPVRGAPRQGPVGSGASPDAGGRDRVVVGPAGPTRATGAGLALGLPRRRRHRVGRGDAGTRRDGPGRGTRRPVAAVGGGGRRDRALPDARDRPRVRRPAAWGTQGRAPRRWPRSRPGR